MNCSNCFDTGYIQNLNGSFSTCKCIIGDKIDSKEIQKISDRKTKAEIAVDAAWEKNR